MYRKRTEDQHSDNEAKGENNKKNREPVIRTIHGESGSNRLRIMTLFFFFKETGSHYAAQAGVQWLFTGAIPLLISTGVLTCSVSDLGRFTPP